MSVTAKTEWRDVPGYEGRYEVSTEGCVRSKGMVVGASYGGTAFRSGRTLSQAVKENGYRQVTLVAADGSRKSWMVHQIVCLAFIGLPSPESQVCHWNGDKADNRIENLRYGTAADNAADRERHGHFVCNLPGREWCSS